MPLSDPMTAISKFLSSAIWMSIFAPEGQGCSILWQSSPPYESSYHAHSRFFKLQASRFERAEQEDTFKKHLYFVGTLDPRRGFGSLFIGHLALVSKQPGHGNKSDDRVPALVQDQLKI